MLLPSPLASDVPPPPRMHPRPLTLMHPHTPVDVVLASPPASPLTASSPSALAFTNIATACHSLHSIIDNPPLPSALSPTVSTAPSPAPSYASSSATSFSLPLSSPATSPSLPWLHHLYSPPLAHAPPPTGLRLRPPPDSLAGTDDLPRATRLVKRRRPALYAEGEGQGLFSATRGAEHSRPASDDGADGEEHRDQLSQLPPLPSTPKRSRIAPERLPLGLERSDYHDVHLLAAAGAAAAAGAHGCGSGTRIDAPHEADARDDEEPPAPSGTCVEREADGHEWSFEDDRLLVELVLEKLKLSKTEWHDCARNLGRDRHAVDRRWKTLMMRGEVGLKPRRARPRLHGTWRF